MEIKTRKDYEKNHEDFKEVKNEDLYDYFNAIKDMYERLSTEVSYRIMINYENKMAIGYEKFKNFAKDCKYKVKKERSIDCEKQGMICCMDFCPIFEKWDPVKENALPTE